MVTCPTCGKQLDTGVRFCPDDGTPLTDTAASVTQTPTGPAAPSKGGVQLPLMLGNRYRLTELRGGGGMAKVYRATDVTLEREVAVKLINPELRTDPEFDARFQREARIASQLADPHIVVVHDFGIDPDYGPYLVMEFLSGQSLRERLAGGPLPIKAALQLCAQMLLALIHAHNKGIVHRDIKPDNVFLLNQSGVRLHVRILDFGIARIYRRDDPNSGQSLTQPGAVLGTPRYMSPEQLAGNPIDVRSDLYSAALVMYEAVTGQLPYVSGKRLCELCPDATPALQDLIEQCLRANPEERPASAVEVYLRLSELGKASGVLLLPPGALDKLVAARMPQQPTVAYVPKGAKAGWRRYLPVAFAALLVLALTAWAGVALVGWFTRPAEQGNAGQQTLHGIKVGESKYDVVLHLGTRPQAEKRGDPSMLAGGHLGQVLKASDLGGEFQMPQLEILHFQDGALRVVLHDDAVVAVVANKPRQVHAATARNVDVGDTEIKLIQQYGQEQQTVNTVPERTKVYRFDALGIGFEVKEGHVTSITLYRPTNNPS